MGESSTDESRRSPAWIFFLSFSSCISFTAAKLFETVSSFQALQGHVSSLRCHLHVVYGANSHQARNNKYQRKRETDDHRLHGLPCISAEDVLGKIPTPKSFHYSRAFSNSLGGGSAPCALVTAEDAEAIKTAAGFRITSVVEIPGASHFVLEVSTISCPRRKTAQ